MRKSHTRILTASLLGALAWSAEPSEALACGGFFCSQNAPVNQAAERIVFASDGQGTVTAVIQIMYDGPSESFSWLLPSPSVPDEVLVSSDAAFQRLQGATNPTYSLTVTVEGTCKTDPNDGVLLGGGTTSGTSASSAASDGAPLDSGGVTVEASGVVGSFEWTVISVDPDLDEPVDAAVTWLEDNGYDVTDDGEQLIAPYLDEGMYLVALKLVKGASVGAIRPIVLQYEAQEPMIPIQLTAVAANQDMGVMVWLLENDRAVPQNYLSLELNEARINWFNASSNYNDVVINAAKEAGGQGFVTEFAGPADTLDGVIWTNYDEQNWTSVTQGLYSSFGELFQNTYWRYASFDGFWEAVEDTVTLPQDVSFEDFQLCPYCYSEDIELEPSEFLDALEQNVIEPFRLMQDLFDDHAYATRLYTTMSAADMTLDPVFTYNKDLGDVSNVHTAERIIECNPEIYQFEAPWRIELPQGGVIRGSAEDAASRVWPNDVQQQPANLIVSQLSESGKGMVVVDNSDEVQASLREYNESLDLPDTPGSESGKRAGGCSMGAKSAGLPWSVALGLVGVVAMTARRRRRAT